MREALAAGSILVGLGIALIAYASVLYAIQVQIYVGLERFNAENPTSLGGPYLQPEFWTEYSQLGVIMLGTGAS